MSYPKAGFFRQLFVKKVNRLLNFYNYFSCFIIIFHISLDRILNFVNISKKSENSNQNSHLLIEQLQNANKIATEKIGVFLALAAAIQLNSRLCSRRGCDITENFDEHCIAPLFLLSKVKHPHTLKQTREMVEYLINRFAKLWSCKKLFILSVFVCLKLLMTSK